MIIDAILLGGGMGRRYSQSGHSSHDLPKQFQNLGTAPVFVHSVRSLLKLGFLRQIVAAVPLPYIELAKEQLDEFGLTGSMIQIVAGGERRQDSSHFAMEYLERTNPLPTRILIHDASRPFLSTSLCGRLKERVFDRSYGAWVPIVPVVDTLKKVESHQVVETASRADFHQVQTPQIFEFSVIRTLAQKAKECKDLQFTDDASLCEYFGIPVGVFPGDVRNIKLTYDFESTTLWEVISQEGKSKLDTPVTS